MVSNRKTQENGNVTLTLRMKTRGRRRMRFRSTHSRWQRDPGQRLGNFVTPGSTIMEVRLNCECLNFYIHLCFLSEGPKSIRKGLLARELHDWLNLRYMSFDFKIRSGDRRRRRTRTVALISAESKRKCCKERNAILGVWIGEK